MADHLVGEGVYTAGVADHAPLMEGLRREAAKTLGLEDHLVVCQVTMTIIDHLLVVLAPACL